MQRAQRRRSYRDAELNGLQVSVDNLQVTREDFGQALSEVRPSFGASLDDLDRRDTPEIRPRCGRAVLEVWSRWARAGVHVAGSSRTAALYRSCRRATAYR